jgi:hypothetical protein
VHKSEVKEIQSSAVIFFRTDWSQTPAAPEKCKIAMGTQ